MLSISTILFSSAEPRKLRSGWKIIIFLLFTAIVQILLFSIALSFKREIGDGLQRTLMLISVAFSSAVSSRLLSGTSFSAYALRPRWWKHFLIGQGIAFCMVALAVIPGWISGGFTFSMNETFSPLQILSCWIFLLIAASLEELLFRGYPLQELAASLGRLPSALIMSVPFALVHTDNPCHTLFANINTLLAGLWLCAAYFKTNNLWLATGLHLGWNFALASVFGINVSGIDAFSQSSFLAAKYNGQQLLTGGCYGIEASLPATVILGLSAATLAFPKRRPDANNSDGRANTSS